MKPCALLLLFSLLPACGPSPTVGHPSQPHPETPPRAAPPVAAPQPVPSAETPTSPVSAPPPAPAPTPVAWRALTKAEIESKAMEAELAFDASETDAYWVDKGELKSRPLAGGAPRTLKAPPKLASTAIVIGDRVLVETLSKTADESRLWLIPQSGVGDPIDAGKRGLAYAIDGDAVWVMSLDAIWRARGATADARISIGRGPRDAFVADAKSFFWREGELGDVVTIPHKGGKPRRLGADATSDIVLDGDGVLWVERDVPEPGREGADYPSKRIQRTPKAGGKARTITTANHPCGLWVSGDFIYFLGEGYQYQSTALFRAPLTGAKTPEVVTATPYVFSVFGCRDAVRLRGTTLLWATKSGFIVRVNLASAAPVVEGLPPDKEQSASP